MPRKKSDPTEYTYEWATNAAEMAKDLGYRVITIKENDTTYDNVSEAIKKYQPRLYIHFGHGCPASLQGQRECIIARKYSVDDLICLIESPYIEDREKLLRLLAPIQISLCNLDNDPCSPVCTHDTNINLLKGSIAVAVACHSASQLGRCAINYGVQTYTGENDLLMFPVDSIGSQDLFGSVQLSFIKELLLGKSIQDAERTMSDLEDSYIRQFKRIKYIALPMLWNKLHRKILGDKNATIY